MIYKIVFIRGDRVLFRSNWESGLDSAKRYASIHMAIRKADRIEVRDAADEVVFRQVGPQPN
jgi:hypothetical protein